MSSTDKESIQTIADEMKYVFGTILKFLKSEKIGEEFDESSFGYFIARLAELGIIELNFNPILSKGKIPMYFTLLMPEKFQSEIVDVCDDNDFLYEMLFNAFEKRYTNLAKKILDKGVIFDDRNSYFKLLLSAGSLREFRFLRDYRQPERENFFHRLQIDVHQKGFDSIRFETRGFDGSDDAKFFVEPKKITKKKFYDFDGDIICHLHGIFERYDSTVINFCQHREKTDVINKMLGYKELFETTFLTFSLF